METSNYITRNRMHRAWKVLFYRQSTWLQGLASNMLERWVYVNLRPGIGFWSQKSWYPVFKFYIWFFISYEFYDLHLLNAMILLGSKTPLGKFMLKMSWKLSWKVLDAWILIIECVLFLQIFKFSGFFGYWYFNAEEFHFI